MVLHNEHKNILKWTLMMDGAFQMLLLSIDLTILLLRFVNYTEQDASGKRKKIEERKQIETFLLDWKHWFEQQRILFGPFSEHLMVAKVQVEQFLPN